MTDNTEQNVLLLSDSDGNLYGIPESSLDHFKLEGEALASAKEAASDDVGGYAARVTFTAIGNGFLFDPVTAFTPETGGSVQSLASKARVTKAAARRR